MKNYIPAFIWAAIILFLSASSGVKVPESLSDLVGTDKLGHLVIYAIFSFLILFGVDIKGSLTKSRSIFAVGLSSSYGVLMEAMQFAFFTGRYFEVLDIIANIIGSFVGLFFFTFFLNKKS